MPELQVHQYLVGAGPCMLINGPVAVLRWPKTGSTALCDGVRQALPSDHWNEIQPFHGMEAPASAQSVLVSCRHPVLWIASWIAHVRRSPAHWPMLSALSGFAFRPEGIPMLSGHQLVEALLPGLLNEEGFSEKRLRPLSMLFCPMTAAARELWYGGQTLWSVACQSYLVSQATTVFRQESLQEGLRARYRVSVDLPAYTNRPQDLHRAIQDTVLRHASRIWAPDAELADALGYSESAFALVPWTWSSVADLDFGFLAGR